MIFLEIVGGIFFWILLYRLFKTIKTKSEISDWQLDDVLIIQDKQKYASLKGWNLKSIVVEFDGSNYFTELNMSEVKLNKSAYWRRLHNKCEKTMGKKPTFNSKVTFFYKNQDSEKESSSIKIHGKPIDLLSETECHIYLKECLEREEYEIAELIKKRMEQFR